MQPNPPTRNNALTFGQPRNGRVYRGRLTWLIVREMRAWVRQAGFECSRRVQVSVLHAQHPYVSRDTIRNVVSNMSWGDLMYTPDAPDPAWVPTRAPRCTTTGKVSYKSPYAARKAILGLHKARKGGSDRLHTYVCHDCGGWHVGH